LLIRIKSGLFFGPLVTGKFIEFLLIGGLPILRLDKHLRMTWDTPMTNVNTVVTLIMICIVNPSPARAIFVEGPVDAIGLHSVDVAIEDRESGHSLDRS
jgi:hypothetical protein